MSVIKNKVKTFSLTIILFLFKFIGRGRFGRNLILEHSDTSNPNLISILESNNMWFKLTEQTLIDAFMLGLKQVIYDNMTNFKIGTHLTFVVCKSQILDLAFISSISELSTHLCNHLEGGE